ncbi:non-homologous end-joining DNA ligase [Streptomyces sp. TRM 70361]|uniref:non-homologous end-joining DNA ligase n=1 Tax=Streptomyces sp. TRM 70361 TaxID=3116553 RepID=UPI002E7C0A0F|nr:non-homologous end-joining DNA ligase [Streptomyces sp. TRM 70361]MEE1939729.1 non-homologous end-joining DNA ligase [Streptomyces sp. TRM 70361]
MPETASSRPPEKPGKPGKAPGSGPGPAAADRHVPLSHPEKVLYPETGFTKGDVVDYYTAVAEVLLPQLRDRPVSFVRAPGGVTSRPFMAKHVPPGTPDWVTVCEVHRVDGSTDRQVVVQDLPTLRWAANLAALELHVPQWRLPHEGRADRLVFDLDPGAPATVVECCEVALRLRDELAADGLESYAKTSGAKGLHLLVPLRPTDAAAVAGYAERLAREVSGALPELAVHRVPKHLRTGRVFIDHSQNAWTRTTAAPYTLRAKSRPTVSTPVTWDEVAGCAQPGDLVHTAGDVPARLDRYGDLLAPLLDPARAGRLPNGG